MATGNGLIKIDIDIDDIGIQNQLNSIIDNTAMLEIHNLLYKMCIPYTPMDEGTLFQTVDIEADGVTYHVPYAHYMYYGLVYGPNIPIMQDGVIVGWFSPPGKTKYPTGKQIQYNKDKHPLASKEWDKSMMRDRRDEFLQQVRNILINRWNQSNG